MKNVLFVCIANYCRSPVAKKIMSNIDTSSSFDSCGLHPLEEPNMDPRSKKFLENNGFKDTIHVPKKISKDLIEENDLIVAMDFIILNNLLSKYKNSSYKFRAFSYVDNNCVISDPYRFEDDEYSSTMNNIKDMCYKWKAYLRD
tara:strand:+ start:4727 stop:5158 length:432 start_codon:yes stop_codon:yes gene_type:complete